jgi:hypothetical protein
MPLGCADCEPCCTSWFDLLDNLLLACFNALETCGNGNCCNGYHRFVSVSEPHDPVRDYIGGWISDVTLAPPPGASAKMVSFVRPRITYNIKLSESGWPMIETPLGGVPVAPGIAERHHAAAHSYSHAQLVFTAARDFLANACGSMATLGSLRPIGPSGGIVGWTFAAQVNT